VAGLGAVTAGGLTFASSMTHLAGRGKGVHIIGEFGDAIQREIQGAVPEEWYLQSRTYMQISAFIFELAGAGSQSRLMTATPMSELPAATKAALIEAAQTFRNGFSLQRLSEFEAFGLKVKHVLPGTNGKIAVIGRSMGRTGAPGVRDYANAMRAAGYEVEIFDDALISPLAQQQFKIMRMTFGTLTDQQLMKTLMYAENQAWASRLVAEGYTVLDLGNPYSMGLSVFYEMERLTIFANTVKP
jgi:hypothetical protein